MLMPSYDPRIYNLQSKQLVKLFSRIFGASHDDMLSELSLGDVSETVATFFDKSEKVRPASKSKLTLEEVDGMLEKLSELTKDDLQQQQLEKIAKKCTSNDLKSIIRLITHDLKINAKASTILEAIHPNAYSEFQASKNLAVILKKFSGKIALVSASAPKVPGVAKTMAGLNLMVPVAPMLAEACKDLDKAIQKAKDGFYSEIKYDGERVQIHKKGKEFK